MPTAAMAADCTGTYTYTHTGSGGTSYNLNAGQSLRILSGSYTASINNFASGAKVCVETGSTFSPNSMNNVNGLILNYGTTNLPGISVGNGFTVENYRRFVFNSNINFNGPATIRNRFGATMVFRNAIQIGNGSQFFNDGTILADQDFNTASGSTFNNNFDLTTKGTFNPNGVVNNYGRITANAFININSNASVINYCSLIADQGFNNSSNQTRNLGLIYINWQGSGNTNLWQNNQALFSGPDSIVFSYRFFNLSSITGSGKFYLEDPGNVSANEHTKNQGAFVGNSSSDLFTVFDTTRTSPSRIFDTQNVTPTNTIFASFTKPRIDQASPGCSATIRPSLYDPMPPTVTFDYSDAPASYGSPVHQIVDDIYLGASEPDADAGSFVSSNSDGDDFTFADDEDAVTIPALQKNVSQTLGVAAHGSGGFLQAWIDYNGNGIFGSGEQIAADLQDNGTAGDNSANDGIINVTFTAPSSATSNPTVLRLRWSTTSGLNATDAAGDGEVEDHGFTFGVAGGGGQNNGDAGSTASTCPVNGTVLTTMTRYALSQTNSGGVANPGNAIGQTLPIGSNATFTNSANLKSGSVLILDLTGSPSTLVAAGGDVFLLVARDISAGRILIESSIDGTNWTSYGSYGNGGSQNNDFTDDILAAILVEAGSSGLRYIRVSGQAGSFWVNGARYSDSCDTPAVNAKLDILKTSALRSGTTFRIPGGFVDYTIVVSNSSDGTVDNDAILVVDAMPSEIVFFNGDFDGSASASTAPVQFQQNGAGLNFDPANDLRYSNSATKPTDFMQCNYTPVSEFDTAIRYICFRPTGAMQGNNGTTSFTLKFAARIE